MARPSRGRGAKRGGAPSSPAGGQPPADEAHRQALERIIGLGERSMRKSYYPELRRRLDELDRFRAMFDHGNDLLLLVELASQTVVDANAPLCRALGRPREMLVGRAAADVLGPGVCDALLERAAEDGQSAGTLTLRPAAGPELPVEVTCRVTCVGGRGLALLIGRDIGRRLRFEAELQAAKEAAERAAVAKSRFLAAASHDLRQPAQAMMVFAELLQYHVQPTGEKLLVHLRQSIDAIADMLDALLHVSRIEAGIVAPQVETFAVGTLIDQMAAEFSAQLAFGAVAFRHVRCSATVRSDPVLLARILRNLISNARRYTREGRILVGCRRQAGAVRIEVWDTGPGIPADKLDEIFEEFVQLGNTERDRQKGLGLGLAIVRGLARVLGHRVAVRSRPGRGSVFSVEVPLAEG